MLLIFVQNGIEKKNDDSMMIGKDMNVRMAGKIVLDQKEKE